MHAKASESKRTQAKASKIKQKEVNGSERKRKQAEASDSKPTQAKASESKQKQASTSERRRKQANASKNKQNKLASGAMPTLNDCQIQLSPPQSEQLILHNEPPISYSDRLRRVGVKVIAHARS